MPLIDERLLEPANEKTPPWRPGPALAWENETLRGGSVVLRDPEGNEFCGS